MSVTNTITTREPRPLAMAFALALAMHAATLAALVFWPEEEPLSAPGEQEITIDFAPAMESVEAVMPAEVAAPAEVAPEAETAPVEETTAEAILPEDVTEENLEEAPELSEAQEIVEAEPVEAMPVDEAPAAQAEAAIAIPPPPETVTARTVEEKPTRQKAAKPPPRKQAQRTPPSNPRAGSASSSRENMGGSAAAADPAVLNRYLARLALVLRGRLRYPDQARRAGVTGVATLRFTMNRSGRIISTSLLRSAGHPMLDQAALAAARPGTTLPAAPDSIPQQQFTFSVPLRFILR